MLGNNEDTFKLSKTEYILDSDSLTSFPGHRPAFHSDTPKTTSNNIQVLNMNFNPTPSTTGKCSKLKLHVMLDSTIYVAGSNLHGRMQISSFSEDVLRLGEICVELHGVEGMIW